MTALGLVSVEGNSRSTNLSLNSTISAKGPPTLLGTQREALRSRNQAAPSIAAAIS
ncbi:MAG: hypothetical protein Q9Q13_00200 [Acidobacteriota bacterium]|nr:hypothetical protein [Acidobacteriota bacterium]